MVADTTSMAAAPLPTTMTMFGCPVSGSTKKSVGGTSCAATAPARVAPSNAAPANTAPIFLNFIFFPPYLCSKRRILFASLHRSEAETTQTISIFAVHDITVSVTIYNSKYFSVNIWLLKTLFCRFQEIIRIFIQDLSNEEER
jgi:hypothetical protein